MFCPRCGRAINENANFCGGCGLSRAEIEKHINASATVEQPAEPVVCEPVAEPVVTETPAEEAPVAETVAVETVAEPVTEETETTYSYTAPEGAEYHYTAQTNPANNSTSQTSYTYTEPVQTTTTFAAETPVKSENLSTVDFIWMMLISSIPVVGLIYIIYLAIQNNNTNKRSYARATLIIALFGTIVGIVFGLGFLIAGL